MNVETKSSSPPVFVRIFKDGYLKQSTLLDRLHGPHVSGLLGCDVCAPNGARAYGELEFGPNEPAATGYEKVLGLLSGFGGPEDLWIDPGHEIAPENLEAAGVIAWAHGEPLLPSEWLLDTHESEGTLKFAVIASHEPIDYLQFWTEPGPSLFVRWPEPRRWQEHTFVLAMCRGRTGPLIRPITFGEWDLADAYWGFLRHDYQEAADQVGRTILDSAFYDEDAHKAFYDEDAHKAELALVGAHWQARFGDNNLKREYRILNHLGRDFDADLMRWVLDFDRQPNAVSEIGFCRALKRIRQDRPQFTETLRLFCERLSAAAAAYSEAGHTKYLEEVGWVRRLAASTYWDSAVTAYRALRPDEPDPTATSASISSATKKKSPRL
jgi:hypothetical protein